MTTAASLELDKGVGVWHSMAFTAGDGTMSKKVTVGGERESRSEGFRGSGKGVSRIRWGGGIEPFFSGGGAALTGHTIWGNHPESTFTEFAQHGEKNGV